MNIKSIIQWQEIIRKIYLDSDLDLDIFELWSIVFSEFSELIISINENDFFSIPDNLVEIYVSVIRFINYLNNCEKYKILSEDMKIPGIIFLHYPFMCAYCLSRPCICSKEEIFESDIENITSFISKSNIFFEKERKVSNFNNQDWIYVFRDIYSSNIRSWDFKHIGLNLIESGSLIAKDLLKLQHFTKYPFTDKERKDLAFTGNIHNELEQFSKYSDVSKKLPLSINIEDNELNHQKISIKTNVYSFLKYKFDLYDRIADLFSWIYILMIKITDLRFFGKDESLEKLIKDDLLFDYLLNKKYLK